MKILAVRDSALGEYMSPFVAPSVGVAIRSFTDEVNRKDCPMNSHPSDYELFELGEFEPSTGAISPLLSPVSIARAKDFYISADGSADGALAIRAVK